jgi:class 3 adenylate cyclase
MNVIRKVVWDKILKKAIRLGLRPANVPVNEKERIQEINNLGLVNRDLKSDIRFSSLPRLATYLTSCSQAAINIIGQDTQYCKVSHGNNSALVYMSKQVPRNISTCSHVLNNKLNPLVIEDCSKDERTKAVFEASGKKSPKFYAGSPIISKNGYILGTFCVYDDNPRTMSHEQLDGMRLLSDQFVELLETVRYKPEETFSGNRNKVDGKYYSNVTILFADFVGFTLKAEKIQPGELLEILSSYFKRFDKIMSNYGLRKVKTIGDAYMAIGGIPNQNSNHTYDLCRAALEMIDYVESSESGYKTSDNDPWKLRIGINTGSVIGGSTGENFDIWGDSVNIASRLESTGKAGKIHISENTKKFLPNNAILLKRDKVNLKNKGSMNTFFLEGFK